MTTTHQPPAHQPPPPTAPLANETATRADQITILIHGTFANKRFLDNDTQVEQDDWWKITETGQSTADRLQAALVAKDTTLAGTVWRPNELDPGVTYRSLVEWTGNNKHSDRKKAGRLLAENLSKLATGRGFTPENPLLVNFVAHSHGGNVVLESLKDPPANVKVGDVNLLGTPMLWRYTDPRIFYLGFILFFIAFFSWAFFEQEAVTAEGLLADPEYVQALYGVTPDELRADAELTQLVSEIIADEQLADPEYLDQIGVSATDLDANPELDQKLFDSTAAELRTNLDRLAELATITPEDIKADSDLADTLLEATTQELQNNPEFLAELQEAFNEPFLTRLAWLLFGATGAVWVGTLVISAIRWVSSKLFDGRPAYGPRADRLRQLLDGRTAALHISREDEASLMMHLGAAPMDAYQALLVPSSRIKLGVAKKTGWIGRILRSPIVTWPLKLIERVIIRPFVAVVVAPLLELLLEWRGLGFAPWSVAVRNYQMLPWADSDPYVDAIEQIPITTADLQMALHADRLSEADEPIEPVEMERIHLLRTALDDAYVSLSKQVKLSQSGYYKSDLIIDTIATRIGGLNQSVQTF